MAKIEVRGFEGTIDIFDLSIVDHIQVHRHFDVNSFASYSEPEMQVHTEHAQDIPKSGRVLEIICVDDSKTVEREKYQSFLYDADRVAIIPVK